MDMNERNDFIFLKLFVSCPDSTDKYDSIKKLPFNINRPNEHQALISLRCIK